MSRFIVIILFLKLSHAYLCVKEPACKCFKKIIDCSNGQLYDIPNFAYFERQYVEKLNLRYNNIQRIRENMTRDYWKQLYVSI